MSAVQKNVCSEKMSAVQKNVCSEKVSDVQKNVCCSVFSVEKVGASADIALRRAMSYSITYKRRMDI